MKTRVLAVAAIAAMTLAAIAFQNPQPGAVAANADADKAPIEATAKAFADAFNKADAKAIAAMWTANGESRDSDGTASIGRAAIEKSYADFFKANPGVNVEVIVKSIRFPAENLAVEEGVVRQSRGPKSLPSTTSYVAVHTKENGKWLIALSSEAGAGMNRLDDLEWLLGDWNAKTADAEVKFSFARDAKKPQITGNFSRTPNGKEALTGSIRIAFDPETGGVRSWGFEDDGAHSQALWHHDGKAWLIECRGVLGNGTPFSETIVLQRVAADAITWRSTDRFLGDEALPDTTPLRLTKSK